MLETIALDEALPAVDVPTWPIEDLEPLLEDSEIEMDLLLALHIAEQ